MSLSVKQILFCEEYVNCHNTKKAALKAGYSEKNAKQVGYNLKQNPEVDAYIKQLENEKLEELGINRTALLVESNKIAKLNIGDYYKVSHYESSIDEFGNTIETPVYKIKPLDELTEDQKACIKKIYYDKEGHFNIEFWDKQKSISDMLRTIDPNQEEVKENLRAEDVETLKSITETMEKIFNEQ